MKAVRLVGAVLACAAAIPSSGQVPPPPLLPGQAPLADALVRSPVDKAVAGYASGLVDGVVRSRTQCGRP